MVTEKEVWLLYYKVPAYAVCGELGGFFLNTVVVINRELLASGQVPWGSIV